MLLNRHGAGQGESVNVGEKHMITPMFGAIRDWYGQIGVERVEANGKLTTQAALVAKLFLIAKFSAGIAMV